MAHASLDASRIANWDDFHRESRREFGFPAFYGNNLSAWIDCMSGVADHDGMSRFTLAPGEKLTIVLRHAAMLRTRAPAVLQGLEDAVREVNQRCTESGGQPLLILQAED